MARCFTPSTCTHGQGPFSRKLIASLEILFGLVIFTPEKLVTVSWRKLCSPLDEGGLNLTSISGTSGATILKLCWSFVYSGDQWVGVLRARFLRNHCQYGGYKKYSLLSSLKQHLPTIFRNKAWVMAPKSTFGIMLGAWRLLLLNLLGSLCAFAAFSHLQSWTLELWTNGTSLSCCYLYKCSNESSSHLFHSCTFAGKFWSWL